MIQDLPISPYKREFIQGVRAYLPDRILLLEDGKAVEGLSPVFKDHVIAGPSFDLEKRLAKELARRADFKGASIIYLDQQEIGLFPLSCIVHAVFYKK